MVMIPGAVDIFCPRSELAEGALIGSFFGFWAPTLLIGVYVMLGPLNLWKLPLNSFAAICAKVCAARSLFAGRHQQSGHRWVRNSQ